VTAQPPELDIVADPAAALAVVLADQAARGGSIVLTGGTSVAEAYERAAALEPDWGRVTLWWGDERCVPPVDERSNYRLAKEALLDRLETPPAEVHRIRGEIEPAAAADELDAALAGVKLDLLLLGLGSDGHMASLFAGSPQLEVLDRRATWGPAGLEPFVDRVTMTLPTIHSAGQIVFIVAGEEKAEVVARVFGREPSHEIPASLARLGEVDIKVFLDPPAASKLDGR
jgi:6-phosphogluconolactonase